MALIMPLVIGTISVYFIFRQAELIENDAASRNENEKVNEMNKFLIASVAVLGMAGVAAAQEAPAIYGQGNISSAETTQTVSPARNFETSGARGVTATGGEGFQINNSDNYSGK
jgi:hypothetical protein